MLKKNFLFFILIFIVTITCVISLNNCKSGEQVTIEEQEAKKRQREKEELKAYEEAVKRHMAKQSKTTRKMMKKSDKQRKKAVSKTIRKNTKKQKCTQ
jgi:hypothetical protein